MGKVAFYGSCSSQQFEESHDVRSIGVVFSARAVVAAKSIDPLDPGIRSIDTVISQYFCPSQELEANRDLEQAGPAAETNAVTLLNQRKRSLRRPKLP